MQEIKDCIVLISLFGQMLFFCICGILGYSFEGSDSSPLFKIVILCLGVANIAIVLCDIITGKIVTRITFYIFALFLPLLIYADFLIESSMPLANISYYSQDLLFLAAFGLTGVFSAFYIAQKGISTFSKWIEIIMLIGTISSLHSTLNILSGNKASIGGTSYQIMSYYAAFCFCLNLCFILFGHTMNRFSIFKGKTYNIISYFLLPIQLIGCLISGGRGGFVLLLACSMYMLYLSHKVTKVILVAALAISMAGSFTTISNDSIFSKKLNSGVARVFSYISDDGIDMKQTSSRGDVYSKAIEQIKEDQYWGRGLFRANADFGNYPHNMFIEFTMQGGFIYMIAWLCVLLFVIYTVQYRLCPNGEFLIIPILAYPFIMLQFSTSYLYSQFFWFGIAYVYERRIIISQ